MTGPQVQNFHATAIVVGTCGILVTGPSGSGKSTLAISLLASARREGLFAALVADDQIFLSHQNGCIVAERPSAIQGMLEIRGSGIGLFHSISHAVMHYAVQLTDTENNPAYERIPPEHERLPLPCGGDLPLIRLMRNAPEPLVILAALCPDMRLQITTSS